MELGLSGLASGFDWRSLVDQLIQLERVPQQRLFSEQGQLDLKKNAYSSIATQMSVLQNRVEALTDPALYDSRKASSSDNLVATADVSSGTSIGSYSFNISQLATASSYRGSSNIGAALSPTSDVSGVVLNDAPLALPITAGTFTVNGQQITIDTANSLQDVFDQINTATGGAVTGSYDPSGDVVNLSSASEIVLGSTTDTSNFLQALKLSNNGTGSIKSASALGSVKLSGPLDTANLGTAITDGGSGAGGFKINGVSISFNTANDSLSNVIDRINNADAGVTASYDSINDRLVLNNDTTGDLGIGFEDVTGNFLAATGITSGTLTLGQNLLYTVNGGGQLSSQSNTITETSSAISGLTLNVLSAGTTTIQVSSDTDKVKTAITDFIEEYNKSQSTIDAETASSTDDAGVVTAGDLVGETEANELASKLRGLVNAGSTGVSGSFSRLDQLGIVSNGTDDTLTLSDTATLDDALANNLSQIKDLFTNTTDGLANELNTYLEATVGEDGLLETKQDNLTQQIAAIDVQIADMERLIASTEENLIASFVAMEEAQSKTNQQLNFLLQRFGTA